MAFPVVKSVTERTGAGTPGVTTIPIALPAVSSGELILVTFARFEVDALDTGSTDTAEAAGWTSFGYGNNVGTVQYAQLYKESDGTETEVIIDCDISTPYNYAAIIVVIQGWNDVAIALTDYGIVSSADCLNLNPGWGAKDTLWLVGTAYGDDSGTITGYPANYSSNQTNVTNGGTNTSAALGLATRELNASAENPGSFTFSELERVTVYTMAVEPGSKGSGGDVTAPTLSSPTGTETGTTTATGTVSTNEGNGTLDAVVTTSATTPSAAQIQAGQDHTGSAAAATDLNNTVSGTGVQNVSFTGLTASTAYYIHYVHEDAAANVSTAVSSASFTTDAGDVTAPVLSSASGTATGQTTADLDVSTDESGGTLYAVVTTSATSPSVAQVKAGQDHTGSAAAFDTSQAVGSTGNQDVAATGLTAATTYYAHFVQTDPAANDSNVASSGSFETNAATVEGVEITLYNGETAQGSITALHYLVTSGDGPDATELASGSAESTDGSGVLSIDLSASAAAVDDVVYVCVFKRDGSVDTDSIGWQGMVTVTDIS